MTRIFTLLFLLVSVTAFTQSFTLKSDCIDTIIKVDKQAQYIEIAVDEDLNVLLREYEFESRFSVVSERVVPTNAMYKLDRRRFYDIVIYACDSLCDSLFQKVIDVSEYIKDDVSFLVDDSVEVNCSYKDIQIDIETEYFTDIHPNPTRNINETVANMNRAGLQELRWFSSVGQLLTNHQVQRMQQGLVICEYAYKMPNGKIAINSAKIVINR